MTAGAGARPDTAPVGAPRPVTPVGILAGRLDELCRLLDAEGAAAPQLRAALRQATALATGLEPYTDRWTTPESPSLRALAERTRAEDWARMVNTVVPLQQEMLSGHVEGQALKFLVRATRARHVLDIGMFTGYSALAMAEGLPADGEVVACEIDPAVAAVAAECFAASPDGHKVTIEVGPAGATLAALAGAGRRFDLVFIDADKGGYVDYLAAVLDTGLLGPDGVICADNTLLQGQPWLPGEPSANGAAIAAFNEAVAADPRIEQVVLPLRDGLTLIHRARQG